MIIARLAITIPDFVFIRVVLFVFMRFRLSDEASEFERDALGLVA